MLASDRSVLIEAPAKAVWAFLADFQNWGPVIDGRTGATLQMTLQESAMVGVGKGRQLKRSDGKGFEQDLTISEWLPPRLMAFSGKAPRPGDIRVTISENTAESSKVELHYEHELEDGILGMVAGFLGVQQSLDLAVDDMLQRVRLSLEA